MSDAAETRSDAASRLRAAAVAAGPDALLRAVLTVVADELEPPAQPAIDLDGSGYILDRRAEAMARAIVGET